MMKRSRHTKEDMAIRYEFALQYLDDKFLKIDFPSIYVLVARKGEGLKKKLRFFISSKGEIEDITVKVADITGFPLYDCFDYFAIYTHRTNKFDIVQKVSEKLFGNPNAITMEKL
jgi:hypothetical protein